MPALNFKPCFADAVEAGTKLQTIRRETDLKVGEIVLLVSAPRVLASGVVESVEAIRISVNDIRVGLEGLCPKEQIYFSRKDGFYLLENFFQFFADQYGLPFEGVLIKWRLK